MAEESSSDSNSAIQERLIADCLERSEREGTHAIARLDHPGIVAIHTVGEFENCPYFAMDWIEGASLAEILDVLVGIPPRDLEGHDLERVLWKGGRGLLGGDAFVVRLKGPKLVYSTYLGGGGNDSIHGMSLDPASEEVVVCGSTASTNFPVTGGAFQTSFQGGVMDVFVTRLDAGGEALVFSTYLGGSAQAGDWGRDVALDRDGTVVVAGTTYSFDFPFTKGAFRIRPPGNKADLFLTRLSPVGGETRSGGSQNGFPASAGAFQTAFAGGFSDGFVTRFDLQPAVPKGVTWIGSRTFALSVRNAPKSAAGGILIGASAASPGLPVLGARIYINLAGPLVIFPLSSDANGSLKIPLPLPNLKGLRVAFQTAWFNNKSCPGNGPFSSSTALILILQ